MRCDYCDGEVPYTILCRTCRAKVCETCGTVDQCFECHMMSGFDELSDALEQIFGPDPDAMVAAERRKSIN